MTVKKRIAVLGGGMSGLTSIKACLEEGLEPTCFEGTDGLGGLWRYRPKDSEGISSLSRSTVINTSKEISAFSDFPPPEDFPNFMHNHKMCQYFELYAQRFGLDKYIKFNHRVKWVTKTADHSSTGRWSVTVVHRDPMTESETELREEYDGVMVCTGHHVVPHFPNFEGKDEFKGQFFHTHSFKTPEPFKDKKVMVIGTGNSGMDAVIETSIVAEKTYLSTRRGFWLYQRVGKRGWPYDMILLNRFKLGFLPVSLLNYLGERDAQEVIDYDQYGLRPSHRIINQHPSMSDSLPNKIITGNVVVKGAIECFVPSGVIFRGEQEVTPLDVVILATGYEYGYSFIDSEVAKITNEEVELYKWVFPPHATHHTMAFIGNVQPIGPLFPISELQARWFTRVFNGHVSLPSKSEILSDIRAKQEFNRETYISGIRHIAEVLYIPYTDELAEQFGAKPNLFWLAISDPQLFKSIMFGSHLAYQYRLTGPHSWKGAREALLGAEGRVDKAFRTNKSLEKTTNQKGFLSFLWPF